MHIPRIPLLLSLQAAVATLTSAEPIPKPPKLPQGGLYGRPQEPKLIVLARDSDTPANQAPNWTTQAWQTHCNNIDYFGDNNDCCIHLSGGTWKNCNGVGWSTISESGVLCYDLATTTHDCCDDDSVCDTGLPCSAGTCSQSSTSVTVCRDGCVSYNGHGCKDGTCAHGSNVVSLPSSTSAVIGGPGATETAPTTTTSTAGEPGGGGDNGGGRGLSTGDKIAIGIGVPVGVFTIVGTLIAWVMCCR